MWLAKRTDFDALRGLSLLLLATNHLILWPLVELSFLLRLTYQSFGWCTFASIYFAIAGIQWGRRVQKEQVLWSWNLRRAIRLSCWVLLSTALFCIGLQLRWWTPAPWQAKIQWLQVTTPFYAVLGYRVPWLIDVIWLHCFLGLFASVLWALFGTRGQFGLLLASSFTLWLFNQIGFFDRFELKNESPSWHHWSGWQLLFIGSALTQQRVFQAWVARLYTKRGLLVLISVAVFFFILKEGSFADSVQSLANTQRFAPLFAFNSFVLLSLLQLTESTKIPAGVRHLGRYSLFAYSVQCLIVYFVGGLGDLRGYENPTLFLILMGSLAAIFLCSVMRNPRRVE